QAQFIPFSAFWLRSSVVSVLISLISDTWVNGPHDIKLIWVSHVSPMRCTTARAWRTPPISVKLFSDWAIRNGPINCYTRYQVL
ncbi:unnamed protein product, partial [Linum tenue]